MKMAISLMIGLMAFLTNEIENFSSVSFYAVDPSAIST